MMKSQRLLKIILALSYGSGLTATMHIMLFSTRAQMKHIRYRTKKGEHYE